MNALIDKNDVYESLNDDGDESRIYGSLNGKFKIGDSVKIIEPGCIYTTYRDMVLAMKLNEKNWEKEELKNNSEIGVVVSRKVHECGTDIIYGVQLYTNNNFIIIREDGLELKMDIVYLNDDLFKI